MFSRRELISSPAHGAIVDGDDLFISTASYEENEENFSVVANPSCRTRSIPVGLASKVAVDTKKDVDDEKASLQFAKGSLKMKKMLHKVRKIPSTLRQNSFLFKSSTNTVAEYEEMDEDGFGLEQAEEDYFSHGDAQTIASLRSSRNNVRTGMSMLVRQTALVMNRPSKVYSNKGITTVSPNSNSNNSDPKNYRSMMLRGKSLVLDDNSIGGMSDITEDASAVYALPMNIHTSFRRTPMFINANMYGINEDDDESESDSEELDNRPFDENDDEDDTSINKQAYDFRTLSPLNDDMGSSVEESPRLRVRAGSEETATRSNAYDRLRRRIYSDSEVRSEAQESNLSSLTLSSNSKTRDNRRSSCRQGSGPTLPRKVSPYASWPFPRTRSYSDSDSDQRTNYSEIQSSSEEQSSNDLEIKSNRNSRVHDGLISDAILITQASRRQSLPLRQSNDEQSPHRRSLRIRTYSDSVVHQRSSDEEILWDPRNIALLDMESPIAIPPQIPCQENKPPSSTESKFATNSSVLSTLSPTNSTQIGQRPLLARKPSARTLNAANRIAAALLPAPAKILPTVPSPSPQQSSADYYWGNSKEANLNCERQEMELKDLCSWSSDSYDDIL